MAPAKRQAEQAILKYAALLCAMFGHLAHGRDGSVKVGMLLFFFFFLFLRQPF